ncbi:MAG: transketolase [Nitrospinota bacterium]
MKRTDDVDDLKEIARRLRVDILKMLHKAGSGHTGGSLSCIDIITALYFSVMDHSPGREPGEARDRFVLSKGHGAPALYAALAECGYFDKAELAKLRRIEGILSGHPFSRITPGVEITTGSLGQGLSQANGLALAVRLDGGKNAVYALLGDGEIQEGQIWEAAMAAAHYKLDNLVAILDNNKLQIDGFIEDIMDISPIGEKWKAFGWHVQEIDGHDFAQIVDALNIAKEVKGIPALIWAHTVKGKGVSFMENKAGWHGIAPNDDELKEALKELEGATVTGNV